MAAMPAKPVPSVGPAEMQAMVARAGLTLNPGQTADLVLAWRQLAGLIATIPRDRALADDQAYVFRLPAPAADRQPKPEPVGKPARKRARPTR
jgi:hypothetical protein